jgi:tetrahydromethanopterin S-methyltransferase subunit F
MIEDSPNSNRRASDCPEWTHEPLRLFMEKLKKIDEMITQAEVNSYRMASIQEAVNKLVAKETILAEVILKQTKQDTGIRILGFIAGMLFPVLVGWTTLLQQDIKTLQHSITVLETKNNSNP